MKITINTWGLFVCWGLFFLSLHLYWVVRKVRTDFEGKLKRRFKFLISFIKFKSFAARTFRTTQYKWRDRKNNPQLSFCLMNVWASSELLLFFIWCLQRYCDIAGNVLYSISLICIYTRNLDWKIFFSIQFRFNKISNKCSGFSFGCFLLVKKIEIVKITVF